jgi:hypothetical protein
MKPDLSLETGLRSVLSNSRAPHGGDFGASCSFVLLVYQDAPGGHSFNRIDAPAARESRKEVYAFLAKYLK